MRGVRFKVPNKYDSYINKILTGISLEKYIWLVCESDAIIDVDTPLFLNEVLNGEDLKKIISHPSYYTIFLNLQAYTSSEAIKTINTYEDFLDSDCALIVFISDSVFVEVYAKDKRIIDNIRQNAEQFSYDQIEYITDENDFRAIFSTI